MIELHKFIHSRMCMVNMLASYHIWVWQVVKREKCCLDFWPPESTRHPIHVYIAEKSREKAFFWEYWFWVNVCTNPQKMERKIMCKWKSRQSEHLRTRYINFEIRVQNFIIRPFRKGIYVWGAGWVFGVKKSSERSTNFSAISQGEIIILKKNWSLF